MEYNLCVFFGILVSERSCIMRRASRLQNDSALDEAAKSGMSHDGSYDARVVVGATVGQVSENDPRPVVLSHFCSSRFKVNRTIRRGDGSPIVGNAVFPNGLPTINGPSLLEFDARVVSNGNLRFAAPRNARAVPIPEPLQQRNVWAFDGGAEEVRDFYGCRSFEELFSKHGVPVC